jgi:hypothetical protein
VGKRVLYVHLKEYVALPVCITTSVFAWYDTNLVRLITVNPQSEGGRVLHTGDWMLESAPVKEILPNTLKNISVLLNSMISSL